MFRSATTRSSFLLLSLPELLNYPWRTLWGQVTRALINSPSSSLTATTDSSGHSRLTHRYLTMTVLSASIVMDFVTGEPFKGTTLTS